MNGIAAPLSSINIGDIRVTWVPDGIHHSDARYQYPDLPPSVWSDHSEVFDQDGWLVMSIGATLIQSSMRTLLVDAGFGPRTLDIGKLSGGGQGGDLIGGQLLDNLASLGVRPDDVDDIVLTHLHLDHIGWITGTDGKVTFPNARYHVHEDEWRHWNQPEVISQGTGATLQQLAVIGQTLALVSGSDAIAPGVHAFPTPGHTPGHTSVLVADLTRSALVLGDAMHCSVELQHPHASFIFDHDPVEAARSRRRILERLSEPNTWYVGTHFPNQVFGSLDGSDAPVERRPLG
ncbi:MBL fold metallo-hydrolase [Dactylosporangium sp. NPDC005572]|uniref:MBL fold metallo-hydrolase n=1 Tax=Dactylosporangium sp. NPDC005572 TaxID=3156889 RepID=UPI0033BEFB1F